jgi:hypothetical protein
MIGPTLTKLALIALAAMSSVALSGCGEKEQTLTSSYNKSDGKAWQGAKNGFLAAGWKPGDKTAWETQIRARGQMQNEYAKVN